MRNARPIFLNRQLLSRTRLLLAALLAVILVGTNLELESRAARIQLSLDIPTLDGTFDLVTTAIGDQGDAHLDCSLASYTTDEAGGLQVKYHDFNTKLDRPVPANGVATLSDVSAGRIAFTETSTSGSYVVVFDTSTQTSKPIADVSAGKESNPSIGGDLVAFEDRSYSTNPNLSEIALNELGTAYYARLTSDSMFDKNAEVSPDGNVVVWEKCQPTGLGCDIYSSIKQGPGLYLTQPLTGAGEDRGPVTNGKIVAYISDKSGENDIYFQPVGGGTEVPVPIPGDQRNLAISGDLIAFESQVTVDAETEYDILVYDVHTAKLYQVTNTAVDDVLNDISTCNGAGRIVYSAPQSGYDVISFTFQIPSSPEDDINALIQLLQSYRLPKGIESRLLPKLQDALKAVQNGDTASACSSLTSFIRTYQALPGKRLTATQLSQLTSATDKIKSEIGCQ